MKASKSIQSVCALMLSSGTLQSTVKYAGFSSVKCEKKVITDNV